MRFHANCRRFVQENRTLKSNMHKELEREDELKAVIQKVSSLIAPVLGRLLKGYRSRCCVCLIGFTVPCVTVSAHQYCNVATQHPYVISC